MFIRTAVRFIFTLHLLCGVLLAKPAFGQRPDLDPATSTLDAANADVSDRPVATTSIITRSFSRRDSRWVPPEIDENVSALESGWACDLDELLQKAGERIQEFVKNVDRFTATESLLHESFKKTGEVSQQEHRKYDYVMSIEEIRPKIFDVEEFQRSPSSLDVPGGVATKGLPTLVLIFHPYYSENYSMRCEGLTTLNGKPAWQIYFRQRADKPNNIRAYRIGWEGPSYPIALKGRAWFAADSYQIVGLQTDLINALPDIRLLVDHTAIEYGPVHFSSRNVEIWLPQNAEVYSDWKGRRFHQRMTFSDYLLFAVDDKQKVSPPKTDP